MRWFARFIRAVVVTALVAGAAFVVAAPADAGKPVPKYLTQVSAFGTNEGGVDRIVVTAEWDPPFHGKPSSLPGKVQFKAAWDSGVSGFDTNFMLIAPKSDTTVTTFTRPAGVNAVTIYVWFSVYDKATGDYVEADAFSSGSIPLGTFTGLTPLFSITDTD